MVLSYLANHGKSGVHVTAMGYFLSEPQRNEQRTGIVWSVLWMGITPFAR